MVGLRHRGGCRCHDGNPESPTHTWQVTLDISRSPIDFQWAPGNIQGNFTGMLIFNHNRSMVNSSHRPPVTQHRLSDLGHYRFRYLFGDWRHQTITWTNVPIINNGSTWDDLMSTLGTKITHLNFKITTFRHRWDSSLSWFVIKNDDYTLPYLVNCLWVCAP